MATIFLFSNWLEIATKILNSVLTTEEVFKVNKTLIVQGGVEKTNTEKKTTFRSVSAWTMSYTFPMGKLESIATSTMECRPI